MNKTLMGIFSFLLLTGCSAAAPTTIPKTVETTSVNVVEEQMVASYQTYQVQRLRTLEKFVVEEPMETMEKQEAIRRKKNAKVKSRKKVKTVKQVEIKKTIAKKPITKKPIVKKQVVKKKVVKRQVINKPTIKKQKTSPTKTFQLSFYSELPEHNGGYTVTSQGEKLSRLDHVVASNYYPIGTRIYLKGYGTVRVADRGGTNFNSSKRLDVLVPRRSGESKRAYISRVWSMGRKSISGYISR